VLKIIEEIYAGNGKEGMCQAREVLDEIVATRFEAYYLLFLAEGLKENFHNYTKIYQPAAKALTINLRKDMNAYKRIRTRHQHNHKNQWVFSALAEGKAVDCPWLCTGTACRIQHRLQAADHRWQVADSAERGYKPEDECRLYNNCGGFTTNFWTQQTGPYTVSRWIEHEFWNAAQCYGPILEKDRSNREHFTYRTKVNCWD